MVEDEKRRETLKKFFPKKPIKMNQEKRKSHKVSNNQCEVCGLNFVTDHLNNEFCEADMFCDDVVMIIAISGSLPIDS